LETSTPLWGNRGCGGVVKKKNPKRLFLSASKSAGKSHFHLPLSHPTAGKTEARSR